MSQKGRATLKEYFEAGKMPTEGEFADLVDSALNQTDDQLMVKTQGEVKYLGIGSVDPQSPLSVRANGTEENLASFEDPEGQETWRISQKPEGNDGFNIGEAGVSPSRFFVQSGSGNIGVGSTDPQARLHVDGDAKIEQDLEVTGNLKLESGSVINNITDHIEVEANNYRSTAIPTERALQDYIDTLFAGTVNAFATDIPPKGWLECNGQAIGRTKYQRLFGIIGDRFGAGDGATTFNVPDLRGEFIRGWDHSKGTDNKRNFASIQYDQIQSHTHEDSGHIHTGNTTANGHHHHTIYNIYQNLPTGVGHFPSGWWWARNTNANSGGAGNHNHSLNINNSKANLGDPVNSGTGTPRHGTETRPRNVALMYCIKY